MKADNAIKGVNLDSRAVEPTPLLITAAELAKSLRLSERKIWAITSPRGDLPCVVIGKLVRYDPVAISAWIAAHSSPSAIGDIP